MPQPPTIPEAIGPYRVRELLGRAGQSTVYRAEDAKGRPVALKLFPRRLAEDAAAAERFHRELASVAPVTRHPHLVHVLETGQHGDRLYVVMEMVEGTSLDRALKARRLSLPEAFAVLRGICRGLVHAHQNGWVHRNLTPRNVLVSPDFATVKISDLGASGFESTAAQSLTATLSTGEIRLGALYYLAPETLEGKAAVDARADLYSAGAIFHEMLTGRSPGPRFGLPSQLNPDVPPAVDVVALRCLGRRPDERYASAQDLLAALERLEETLRLRVLTEIREAGSLLRGGGAESGGKRTLLYAGIALAALALLAVAFFLLR
ncbi:MAG TPA: serine/threonine-protein kinase [Thermoanaerobaculia bacterium]|jgi:serine/threonine-protein kinase|nr:serine/threonine-protein kinase [Thermoanaerobaculia bacterium]